MQFPAILCNSVRLCSTAVVCVIQQLAVCHSHIPDHLRIYREKCMNRKKNSVEEADDVQRSTSVRFHTLLDSNDSNTATDQQHRHSGGNE